MVQPLIIYETLAQSDCSSTGKYGEREKQKQARKQTNKSEFGTINFNKITMINYLSSSQKRHFQLVSVGLYFNIYQHVFSQTKGYLCMCVY